MKIRKIIILAIAAMLSIALLAGCKPKKDSAKPTEVQEKTTEDSTVIDETEIELEEGEKSGGL